MSRRIVLIHGVTQAIRVQHRALLIGAQQRGVECIALTSLLRQQPVAVLDDRVLDRALYLGGQAAFAVKTLMLLRVLPCMADQPVEGVVAIVAEGFAPQWHGDAPTFDQYWRFRNGWELAELIGRSLWTLE